MEYSLKQENCTICENLLRSSSEQPVDLELTLPDHCPDIERILKCRMEHSITSEIITGSRLDIDGMISVRLYYLDSKKQAIRYYENNTPFSCSFELKRTADDAVCRVRIRNEYLNCPVLPGSFFYTFFGKDSVHIKRRHISKILNI